MRSEQPEVMGWGTIIAIMTVTGVLVGALLGGLGPAFGLAPGRLTAGVGASIGVVGALLISRRRAALALRKPAA